MNRLLFLSLAAELFLVSMAPASGRTVSFNRDIRPILSENCYYCHGFDPAHREADLRLDTFEGATAGKAIVPGKPEESALVKRIFSTDPEEVMPVPKSHRTLTPVQKDLLKTWIAEGAVYEAHWAFIPPAAAVPVPDVKNAGWPKGALDHFVLAKLEQKGITPVPAAVRERWLRRVTFDLTGLPPTQPEWDAFLKDPSAQAYETVVDRLLKSPRFGERMAVPWLDLARYADSFGYQADVDTGAWPWRDWVISALNDNLPWDQFITWQIAGDLLPEATRDQRLATAFNRIHRKTNEGGSIEEEWRQEGVSDRVHTFGTAFLALTFECSRCHDHKYDPITARDYYSLGAFFNFAEAGVMQYATGILPQPALLLPAPAQEKTITDLTAALRREESVSQAWAETHQADFEKWLAHPAFPAAPPDLMGSFSLDALADGKFPNAVKDGAAASPGPNMLSPGREGQGVLLRGDDALSLPALGFEHVYQPVSFSFWLKPGEAYPRAVVFSNTASADTNYSGYELMLEDGRLRWTIMREFPANAVSIRSRITVPVQEWTHLTLTYDGSLKAAGMKLYLNGQSVETETVADTLRRDFRLGGALLFGARSRDSGLRGGMVDEIRVFSRAVTGLEASQLCDGRSPAEWLAKKDRTAAETSQLSEWYFSAIDEAARARTAKLQMARDQWGKALQGVREISVMEDGPARPTFILNRGAYDAPGEPVTRNVPSFLPPLPAGAPVDRLALARWLTQPDHPLTARVLVNRIWQEFFGRGLVATSDNFGMQGELPSHPELLDWLARDFINRKWDHKAFCRQIVLSATYRQDSLCGPTRRELDPDNALLSRGPSRRLTAEMLRDSALVLGGLLQPQLGGPPVLPYQAEGSMWKALNNFLPEYKADTGAGLYRRSLYTFWRRTTTPPNMMALDATTREVCAARRQPTNTPLQPLVLMNDPQFVEAARFLGQRMLKEGGATVEERVGWLFREVTGRLPTQTEQPLLTSLYQDQAKRFQEHPADAAAFLKVGASAPDPALPPAELAAAAATAAAIFNLDASLVLR